MRILCRTACLGEWVTETKFGTNHDFYSQRKVRVDTFIEYINGFLGRPKIEEIKQWLERKDLDQLFIQQNKLEWIDGLKNNPDLIIIDSYSELVDQKFIHKDNWGFCCCYSDLLHDRYTDKELICHGLLPQDKLYENYVAFFDYIKKYTNCPIIFIHFPTIFDTREIYINQGKAIFDTITKLADIYNIQNIYADSDCIEQKDSEVYHFADKTVKNLAGKIIFKE